MPVYSPVNPNLVAFNPTQITNGMGQAFQLAQQYEQLKASKALQAEAEATRQARIAQQNALAQYDVARTQAALPTLVPRAELDIAKMGNERDLLGPERDARLAGLKLQTAQAGAELPNVIPASELKGAQISANLESLAPITAANIAQAKAQTAAAQSELSLAPLKRETMGAQLMLGQKIAQLQMSGAEPEQMLKNLRIAQQLGDAKTDAEYKKALRDADLELKKSQIDENKAQAAYALGLGRQAMGAQERTPAQKAKQLQDLIMELDRMKVGDGIRTLGVYKSDTFNNDGTVKSKFLGFGSADRDPVGDFYLSLRESYQNELKALQPLLSAAQSQNNTQGQTSRLPKVGDVVNGYRFKGGNPKDRNSWDKVN